MRFGYRYQLFSRLSGCSKYFTVDQFSFLVYSICQIRDLEKWVLFVGHSEEPQSVELKDFMESLTSVYK